MSRSVVVKASAVDALVDASFAKDVKALRAAAFDVRSSGGGPLDWAAQLEALSALKRRGLGRIAEQWLAALAGLFEVRGFASKAVRGSPGARASLEERQAAYSAALAQLAWAERVWETGE